MFDGFWEVTEIAHNSIYSSAYRGYTSKIYTTNLPPCERGGDSSGRKKDGCSWSLVESGICVCAEREESGSEGEEGSREI